MSKISKYKETICTFLTTKSCFSNIIDKALIDDFMQSELSLFPIALLAVFNSQIKKNKSKSYHILHIASAIILMTLIVVINENMKYYEEKYGEKNIKKVVNQATIFIFEAISQNIKTMGNASESDVASRIEKKVTSFLHDKLLTLTEMSVTDKKLKMKKTDIIKFHFEDKNIIDEKYKKLSRIESEEITEYVDNKYGTIGQCAFILGWLMGMSDANPKVIDTISSLGTSFGIITKLTHDFKSLEQNISTSKDLSYNFIVNCGIHKCFALFDEHKNKFINGCMANSIFNGIIKELIENLDSVYDACLENTSLELASTYSTTADGTKSTRTRP